MIGVPSSSQTSKHLLMTEPSRWFARFGHLIPAKSDVLDVAAGGGRHVRFFSERGHRVTAVDKNIEPLQSLVGSHGATVIETDLEDGSPWPFTNQKFDAVAVCNYLHRPLFDDLIGTIKPGGLLLYETFALGNEIYNRPRNPDHLLKSGELIELIRGRLQVVAYAHGVVGGTEAPGVKQMICAVNNLRLSDRDDGEPLPVEISP